MAQPQPRPLASLHTAKISSGCPQLDRVLGGGLPCGSLTELAGEAAASKTQLCLQLLLSVQLPLAHGGLQGSAVYLYTEGAPAVQRLQQLARCLRFRYPPEALAALPDPAANVFVERGVGSGPELLARLQRLRGLLEQQRRRRSGSRPVRLLVVDSVAHVFRELGGNDPGGRAGADAGELAGRAELLFKVSALLRRYADEFGLAVLLVNQVVDCVEGSGGAAAAKTRGHSGGMLLASAGRQVVPALGLAWANCVNTRLFLSRCAAPGGANPAPFRGAPSPAAAAAAAAGERGGGALAPVLRRLQVVFAPHLARGREGYYVVEASGVRGLHPEELQQHRDLEAAAAAAAQRAAWEEEQRQRQTWRWEQQQQGQGAGGCAPPPPHQQQQGWRRQQQSRGADMGAGPAGGAPQGQPWQAGSLPPHAGCQRPGPHDNWQQQYQHQQRHPLHQHQQQAW